MLVTTYPNAGVIIPNKTKPISITPMITPIQFQCTSFKFIFSCFQHEISVPNPITMKHPPIIFESTVAGLLERLIASNIQAPPANKNDDMDGMRNRTIISKKINPYIE